MRIDAQVDQRMGLSSLEPWSSTQAVIALSSGEVEYYGLVKAAAQSLGIKAMLRDFGVNHPISISVRSDSSAAISTAQRRGFGKVRHIEVNQLWLQERVANRELTLVKVPRTANATDHLTEPGCAAALKQHMEITNQRIVEGRHADMPTVAK